MLNIPGNEQQQKAITHFRGPAMIVAGPGSGKTFVICNRIQHLITHHHIRPEHILVITFTKSAALEMQNRFLNQIKPLRAPVNFGTFHAVFYHILHNSSIYRNYSIVTDQDKRKHLHRILYINGYDIIKEEGLSPLLQIISELKCGHCLDYPTMAMKDFMMQYDSLTIQDILTIYKMYQSYLKELQLMDFDDIQLYCYEFLLNNPDILQKYQEKYSFILIDEFQDISPIQNKIIKLLSGPHNNLFVVGDDDQSIYRFRGASPENMLNFRNDYPDCHEIHLNMNYRCHKQIVTCSQKMISENKIRISKNIQASHEIGVGVKINKFQTIQEEEQYLIQTLKDFYHTSELDHCALICRTNFECTIWSHLIHFHQIPYIFQEYSQSLFQKDNVMDLIAYLKIATGHHDRNNYLRIMNKPVRYLKRDSLTSSTITEENWQSFYHNNPVIQNTIHRFYDQVQRLQSLRPILAIRYIREIIGYDDYIKEALSANKQSEAILQLNSFSEYASNFHSIEELLTAIKNYDDLPQQKSAVKAGYNNKLNLHNNNSGISIMTIHASKGLEFDTVFIPGCQDGKIPSNKSETKEELEEERRMLYVAMTRAKNNLYISCVDRHTGKDIPSRFLENL